MSDKRDLTKKFEPISDHEEILNLFEEGLKTLSSLFFWTKNQEQIHPSHFNLIVAQDKTFCINKPTAFQQEEFAHITE
ncbi:MAG: hypothetical protein HY072_03445, partial [Deltaproteobacteria bacterium]|nr:hypothetical protein [Deltaproteobacteria bacterium]